jgi:hypothetical protein
MIGFLFFYGFWLPSGDPLAIFCVICSCFWIALLHTCARGRFVKEFCLSEGGPWTFENVAHTLQGSKIRDSMILGETLLLDVSAQFR